MEGALERIQQALKDCPHERGVCGQPAMLKSDDPDAPEPIKGVRGPTIGLYADDIVAVCDKIPVEKRDKKVKALRKGSLPNTIEHRLKLGPLDDAGQPLDESSLAPLEVYILVDDAEHLAKAAAG